MPAEQASVEVRRKAAREVIDILHEIATLLVGSATYVEEHNTNCDRTHI
jgi:hypothetical protein